MLQKKTTEKDPVCFAPLKNIPHNCPTWDMTFPFTRKYTQCIESVQASPVFIELPWEAAKHC